MVDIFHMFEVNNDSNTDQETCVAMGVSLYTSNLYMIDPRF